ncbi:MAG: hypothetical protein ACI4PK_03485 [Oscillospiraceae bacterium]
MAQLQKKQNRIYLSHNSWVVAKLEEKIEAAHYKPAEGRQDKVSVGYDCLDSGAPNPETMSSVIRNSLKLSIIFLRQLLNEFCRFRK